jgi:hypothetical protein
MTVSKRRNFSFQVIAEQLLGGLVFWKPILERIHPETPHTWSRKSDFVGKEGSRFMIQNSRLKIKIQEFNRIKDI